jgi:predicted permease
MTIVYRLLSLLKWVFRRDAVEKGLARDLDDFIERSVADKMQTGMTREEAKRAVRFELGGIEQTKDEVRARLAFGPFDTIARDIRYAFRSFRRRKTFTAVILLCLALGIGANTTVFSFLHSILLKPLPVEDPGSLVALSWSAEMPGPEVPGPTLTITSFEDTGDGRFSSNAWSYPVLELFADDRTVVSDVIGRVTVDRLTVDDGEGPTADGTFVTGNYFSGLGVRPLVGRLLGMDDDRFGAPPAVVLSAPFSESRFGSVDAALGETLRLNGVAFTVIGVTPEGFFGIDPARSPDFFIPLRSGPLFRSLDTHFAQAQVGNTPPMYQQADFYWISIVARLRPDTSLTRATTVLGTTFDNYFAANAPDDDSLRNPPVLAVESAARGLGSLRIEYRDPLFVLFAMVLLILAVTCAGIAALQLSRAASRRPEMAIRLSLGGGRPTLIRQLLTESVLLALVGGLLGVLFSLAGTELLTALLTIGNEERALRAALSGPVLAFTSGVSLVTGILFGLAPALNATRVNVFPALKGSRSIEPDPKLSGRLRLGVGQVLVVSQIALSLVLLIGASLFATTLSNIRTAELGYNPDGLVFATVSAVRAGYSREELVTFYQTLRSRLLEIPGVDSVSYSWSPLAGGGVFDGRVSVPGSTDEPEPINIQIVGEEFFKTLEIPMLRGRGVTDSDIGTARAVAVVDETFAETHFPGVDPIGRTINVANEGELTIVGVAADSRQDMIRNNVLPVVYFTYTWDPHELPVAFYELRTRADPAALGEQFRLAVRDLDPAVMVTDTSTHTEQIDRSNYQQIVFARLSQVLAGLALLIACVALYGTVSYAMTKRTAEIGIRMALGASRSLILKQSFRQVLGLGIAGLMVGVPIAIVAARAVESFLWGVAPYDPAVLLGGTAAVLAAIALAGFLPARRASRIEPMIALRGD